MNNLITTTKGHQMFKEAYEHRLNHFNSLLERHNISVVESCKPAIDYDYSYLVQGEHVNLPREVLTGFCRAGLRTQIQPLSGEMSIIRLTYC